MPLNIGSLAASLFGGTEAPDTLLSGLRDVHAGGIAVGSKVVGSGSAATTIPPVAGGAPVTTSAGAVVPAWLPFAALALAAAFLVALVIPRRRT